MKRFVFVFLVLCAVPNFSMAQQNPFEALKKGMELHSDSLVTIFFDSWFSISADQRKNPETALQKAGEEILEFLSADIKNDKSCAPYIVIYPFVTIYIDSSESAIDSLDNMFPSEFLGAKTLVETKDYLNAIQKYVGWHNNQMGYVKQFTEVSCHEGGCGVMMEPIISSIRLYDNQQTAVVRFGMNEEGWDYTLSKAKGKWIISKKIMRWIE